MKFAPISLYDVAAQQAWLEDEAARGRFLTAYRAGIASGFVSFHKDAPRSVRYRFQPLARKEKSPDPDRRDVYQSLGWDYVCTAGGTFHIWRCDDPEAPELDTDPVIQGTAYDRLCRRLTWANCVIGAILLLPVFLAFWFHLTMDDYFPRLVSSWEPIWEAAALALAVAACLPQFIYWDLSLRRFVRTLKAGVPTAHRRPYRLSRFLGGLTLVVYILFVVSRTAVLFRPNSRPFEPAETFEEPIPYVSQLGPAAAIPWNNWRTQEQWWIIQEADGAYTESHYYDFRFPWMAARMTESLCLKNGLRPLDTPGLDGAWSGDRESGLQILVLRLDSQVLELYTSDWELTEYLSDCSALLADRRLE